MQVATARTEPKFNRKNQPDFFAVLNQRVNAYFAEPGRSRKANASMVVKTVVMLGLYFVPLLVLLLGGYQSPWVVYGLWGLMGLGMAGIGLCVMHDANHGSYSSHRSVNRAIGFVINFMGCYHGTWQIQHNVLHHSYTNIEGFDEDTDNELMRFTPNRPGKWLFRYQAYYAPFFYCLMSLNRFLVKDFVQVVRFHRTGLLAAQGRSFAGTLAKILFHKSWYVGLTLVLPVLLSGLPVHQVLLGFLLMHAICGLILALIFQSAHILEETDFFRPGEAGHMTHHWAVHQVHTTANFANASPLFSWLIGGLNFQIEHHLFPNICHVHYRALSGIVRTTTAEFGLPYHAHTTFAGALRSHFVYLDRLGRGK